MTDNYGNDPHNEHGDPMHDDHGHDDPLVTEGEAWHDEHPPVDDFADQPSEEIATVSEETGILEEHDEPEIARRKTSVLLPVAAGIGGLLFLGALLYWQFGGMFKQQALAPIPPLRVQNIATIEDKVPLQNSVPPATLTPAAAVAPTTSLAAIVDAATSSSTVEPALPGVQSGTATPKTGPAPVAVPAAPPTSSGAVTPSVSTPAASMIATSVPATPAPVAAVPVTAKVSSAVITQTPAASTTVAIPAAATAVAAISSSTTKDLTMDARLNALTSSVEGLQKSLAATTQQLNQVSNMIAANPPNSGIEDRLTKIEQKLSQRQAVTVTAPLSVSESPVMLSDNESITTSTLHHHTSKAKLSTAIASSDSENLTPSRSAHHHVTAALSIKSKTPHWILRAATPTEAWVSTDPFSPDLRHLQIGDTLPGIGKIRAINQRGDNWIVIGSKGTLK